MRAALSKVEGVASIDVDFTAKTATITMNAGKTLTSADCAKAFAGTRYSVASLESVGN